MTSGEARQASLTRGPGVPQQATLLELFFDVVFVAAIAVTSTQLSGDMSWPGAARTLVPLAGIWWVWVATTLVTDVYDPEQPPIQVILAGTMLGTVLASVSAPQAFSAHGLLFASSLVAVHVGRAVLFEVVTPDAPVRLRTAHFLFWFSLSGVPWVTGGLAHGTARGGLWAAALVVDYVAGAVRYPTPFLGRISVEHYKRTREHLGERYRQFIILALGDTILVSTLRYSVGRPTVARTTAFLIAFLTAALLWRIVILRGGSAVTVTLPRRAGGSARFAPYTHFVMVTGVVTISAAFESTIDRPGRPASTGLVAALMGGTAIFVVARIVFDYVVFYIFSRSRAVWVVLLVAAAPLAASLPALAVAGTAVAMLLGLAVTDVVRLTFAHGRVRAVLRNPRRQRTITGP